jgi:ABC-2 type transport system ATP-binding protein
MPWEHHPIGKPTLGIAEGEIFGLVGPDGARKTTTMRLLTAIMEPTSGEAWVAGHHIGHEADALKEEIGYMSQRLGLYPDLTVMENIHFYADLYGVPRKGRGEKMERLALGCAVLHEPAIIFLDEPTAGVDPISRRRFWDLIYELSGKGVTVFVTTHYLDEAEYCDRLRLIHRGELIATGTPQQLETDFMQEEILEVVCERPQDAMGALETVPGVQDVALVKGIYLKGVGLEILALEAGLLTVFGLAMVVLANLKFQKKLV